MLTATLGTRYALAVALWIGWGLPFLHKALAPRERAVVKDSTARWGVILVGVAFGLCWGVPAQEVDLWRISAALVFAGIGIVTTRAALRHLDKQWRVDAGLNADHRLIQTGPYRIVRHPIYAGMLAMLLALGLLLSRWPALLAALVLFIAGTEIRVRTEDRLLRGRFGKEFESYAARVPAYLPWLR
jgi:protein-S-isoprenylcysteine O-methyltransferase Ste14